jgi:hypothetical protein
MQSNTARLGVLAAVIAVAAVLFIVLSGGDDEDSGETQTDTATQTTTKEKTTAEDDSEASIVFRNGRVVGGIEEINASGGDNVFIVVDSDESADIHVHGYEVEAPVDAGEPSQVAFTADLEGVFEVELHLDSTGEEVQIGELTVKP